LIPHANAARAPALKVPPWVAATLRALGASIAVLVLAQYLAGFFFLWLSHLSLSAAGPLTVLIVWIAAGLAAIAAGHHAPVRFAARRAWKPAASIEPDAAIQDLTGNFPHLGGSNQPPSVA